MSSLESPNLDLKLEFRKPTIFSIQEISQFRLSIDDISNLFSYLISLLINFVNQGNMPLLNHRERHVDELRCYLPEIECIIPIHNFNFNN